MLCYPHRQPTLDTLLHTHTSDSRSVCTHVPLSSRSGRPGPRWSRWPACRPGRAAWCTAAAAGCRRALWPRRWPCRGPARPWASRWRTGSSPSGRARSSPRTRPCVSVGRERAREGRCETRARAERGVDGLGGRGDCVVCLYLDCVQASVFPLRWFDIVTSKSEPRKCCVILIGNRP